MLNSVLMDTKCNKCVLFLIGTTSITTTTSDTTSTANMTTTSVTTTASMMPGMARIVGYEES
jgi:hypothetical protein